MVAKRRAQMQEETRAKLIKAARKAFAAKGYAASSMDELTADAGLTRGALYHNFGDKKGLLQAVVQEIDAEMSLRLQQVSASAPSRWQGFVDEYAAYIEMALEPEIQRIMFRDGPAVLGDMSQWPSANGCIVALKKSLSELKADGMIVDVDEEATARLLNGASIHAAMWIANSDDPQATSSKAVEGFRALLEQLRVRAD